MKPVWFILISCLMVGMLSATTYLNEKFDDSFLPTGWSVDSHSSNWQLSNTNHAGGVRPEAMLNYSPDFSGMTRLITPVMDVSGESSVTIDFKQMLDFYSNSLTIGVATRSGTSGTWHSVWEQVLTASLPAEERSIDVTNSDLGTEFQVCFYFTSDNSEYLNYWYIDNVHISAPSEIDVAVNEITLGQHYDPNVPMTPTAVIANPGLTDQTFNVLCTIDQWDTPVYSSTESVTLAAGATQSVSFDAFTPAQPGEIYYIHVTTQLTGDMDNSNDTLDSSFDAYTSDRANVLMEFGTGTWCTYCPGAAMGADDMIENGNNAAIIEYHNGDNYETTEANTRLSYYGVSAFPTAIFDGLEQYVGGNHSQSLYSVYLPLYEDRIVLLSPFEIEIQGSHTDSDYEIQATVHKTGRVADGSNFVLHLAVTESDIQVSWQGQNHLDFVERKMLPGANGNTLSFTDSDTQVISRTFTMGSSWVPENCEIVAFVQNPDTKEVFQAVKVAVPDLVSPFAAPTNLSYTVNGPNVNLSWTSPATDRDLTGYKIYRDYAEVGTVDNPTTLTYVDSPSASGQYYYYVTAMYGENESAPSNAIIADVTSNGPGDNVQLPTKLNGAFPNPFNPNTTISYSLKTDSKVTLNVYDIRGRLVRTLVDAQQTAGAHRVSWNGTDNAGQAAGSGVYFVKMNTGDESKYTAVKKMILLK